VNSSDGPRCVIIASSVSLSGAVPFVRLLLASVDNDATTDSPPQLIKPQLSGGVVVGKPAHVEA
jgi:hypothetical protein